MSNRRRREARALAPSRAQDEERLLSTAAPPHDASDSDPATTVRRRGDEVNAPGSIHALLPPYYGRPRRANSPDVFNTLFEPVIRSLSRPPSPPIRGDPRSAPVNGSIRAVSPRRAHIARDLASNGSSNAPCHTSTVSSVDDSSAATSEAQRSSTSLPSHFPPRLPSDPAPTVESQGFVLYVSSAVVYCAYLVWAFVPERGLERIGIGWYPSREWALLVPSWITVAVVYVYLGYFCLNLANTPTPTQLLESRSDPKAFVAPLTAPLSLFSALERPCPHSARSSDPGSSERQSKGNFPAALADDGGDRRVSRLYFDSIRLPPDQIPPLYDLPPEVVDRVLYG
ncbi:hypothetical protein JCM10212_004684 [Sporobolomyces blumeae]